MMIRFMNLLAVVLFITSLTNVAVAQSGIRPIKVGDKVPNIVFGNMQNYYKDKVNSNEFKGKLLIIDVWNRWCSACITAFPKMEKLQETFKDSVAVILLTDDPVEEFNKLRAKSFIIKNTKLPISVGDTLIKKLFPHKGVPLHIWIDSSGTAIAITSGYNTTETTIRNYLNGHLATMNRKDSGIIDFEKKKPLFAEGNGRQLERLEAYSAFYKSLKNYRPSATTILRDSATNKMNGYRKLNSDLPLLIGGAYAAPNVVLDFPEGEKYYPPTTEDEKNQFVDKYQFCYEIKLPERLHDSLSVMQKYMQEDICRFFNLEITLEDRKRLTYSLISTGDISKIMSPKNNVDTSISEIAPPIFYIRNASIQALTYGLYAIINKDKRMNKINVNNNTGYTGSININIKITGDTISSINKSLKLYNLMLIPKYEIEKVAIAKLKR